MPDFLETFITSEQNSYGIIYGLWTEGKELRIESNFGSKVSPAVRLSMKKTQYLPKTSKCSMNKSYYGCLGSSLFQQNHTAKCPKACVPYSLKDFSNLIENHTHLSPLCESIEEQSCRNLELAKVTWDSYRVIQIKLISNGYISKTRHVKLFHKFHTGWPKSISFGYNSETIHFWPYVDEAKMCLRGVSFFQELWKKSWKM